MTPSDVNNIFAVGLGGIISSTKNGGTSWASNGKIGTDFNTINFITQYTGFIGGNMGTLYRINSGGDYFTKINLGTTKNVNKIFFLDSLVGFLAGDKGLLKKTTNCGSSWVDIPFDSNYNISLFSKYYDYASYRYYFFIGSNSYSNTYISNDTGRTWTAQPIPGASYASAMDGKFLGTTSGEIYQYDASTSNWQLATMGVFTGMKSLYYFSGAYNSAEVLALDGNGLPAYRFQGNNNWIIGDQTNTSSNGIYGGYYRNFIFGNNGRFMFSPYSYYNTYIRNWETEATPTNGNYQAMVRRFGDEYWLVGDDGIVNRVVEKSAYDVEIAYDTALTVSGDTAFMDIKLTGINRSFSAIQFDINYSSKLKLIGFDTSATLIGDKKWACYSNNNANPGKFAASGANDISYAGTLLRLKFFIPDSIKPAFFPIYISSLVLNNGGFYINTEHQGSIKVVTHGDVDTNGVVQAYDASLIQKHLVGFIALSKEQKRIGDVTKDGTLSDVDASLILRYVVGIIDTLPAPGSYPATGTIAMQDYTANAGQLINIPVTMNQVTGLMGFEGTISFDDLKLEFMGATSTGITSDFAIEHKVTNGKILVAAASQVDAAGSGESVILHFKVKENAIISTTKVKIARIRLNENAEQFDVAESNINILTGVRGEESIPKEYELSQNYPNPFNPETRISFGVPEASSVTLQIFNSLGEKVATLVNEEKPAGYYNINWNALNFSTGVYIVRITATSNESKKSFMQIKKMVLVK